MEILGLQPLTNDVDRNLQAQINFFDRQGNRTVADTFRGLQNERNSVFNGFRTDLLDRFDAFEQARNPSFNQFLQASGDIANRIIPEIENQAQQVRAQFGPNGEITNQANRFFSGLINAVNNSVAGNVASAGNQAIRSGGSQSAINAAINQARQQGIQDLLNVNAQKLQQQQSLFNNLTTLQDSLRQQRFAAENELIRNPLLQLNNQVTELGSSILWGLQWFDASELQQLLTNRVAWGSAPSTQTQTSGSPLDQLAGAQNPVATWFEQNGQAFRNEIVWQWEVLVNGQIVPAFFDAQGNQYTVGPNWVITPLV